MPTAVCEPSSSPASGIGTHLTRQLGRLDTTTIVVGSMIVSMTATNTRGLNMGAWIQNLFTTAKTAALIGLIVIGCALGRRLDAAAWTASWWDSMSNGWTARGAEPGLPMVGGLALAILVGKAMIGPLFSQSAWNIVTFTGGETRDPERTPPFALITGCGLVVALYWLALALAARSCSRERPCIGCDHASVPVAELVFRRVSLRLRSLFQRLHLGLLGVSFAS